MGYEGEQDRFRRWLKLLIQSNNDQAMDRLTQRGTMCDEGGLWMRASNGAGGQTASVEGGRGEGVDGQHTNKKL